MKQNVFLIVVLSSLFLISGCTQPQPSIYYGSADVIFSISEDEGSIQLDSKKIQISLNYSTSNKTGLQSTKSFIFPEDWSNIDYWLNITIKFNDLQDHYITIEIDSIGWIDDSQRYATKDKYIGHDAYRNGFPERAIIRAWRLGTGPGCEYEWPDTGC